MADFGDVLGRLGGMLSRADADLLYETARELQPRTIVEIGAFTGSSSAVLGTVAQECDGHLYSIEPVPKDRWRATLRDLGLDAFATLIACHSPWIDIGQIPLPIDYILIDGNHKTKFCITDFQFWQRYVREGGRIAFHDWCGANKVGAQVQRAVEIILETDNLVEVGRAEATNRGLIVFEKQDPAW